MQPARPPPPPPPTTTTTTTEPVQAGLSRTGNSAGPAKPPVVIPGIGNNIIVNPCQRGNPVLECARNVGKEFGDIVADYQVGRTTGVLFLSLKYHRLHPEYILQRIERLGTSYNLRILLLMCDVSEHQEPIRELTKTCLINNITIMTAFTTEEAGFYLSTYKQFEHKPPDMIKERVSKDYSSMLRASLTSISKVNKTDVEILRTSFGSLANISKATSEQLLQLPGFGQVKVRRMRDAFEKPFRNNTTSVIPFQSQRLPEQTKAPAKDKGKGKATDSAGQSGFEYESWDEERPELNLEWDIELDLNASPLCNPNRAPVSSSKTPAASTSNPMEGRKRPPSPVWDIELDLNDSDIEPEETSRKRPKVSVDVNGETVFEPTLLL